MDFREQVLLKDWAWWKIGGPADFFCLPESIEQVRESLEFARVRGIPVSVLGGGTNVLISDAGVEGLVICMRKMNALTLFEDGGKLRVEALAGTPKSELTRIYMKRKLAPALFLCGLPGDVGGGVVMNAGVAEQITPREFVEITDWIEVMNMEGKVRRIPREEMGWTYRHTTGWQPGIVVRACVSWALEVDEEIPRKVREATKNRLARQPLELPSCGSTFKNPLGGKAGALIEQVGLKGYSVGGAQVSPKHANFIVNVGGATAADVMSVIKHVQTEVKSRSGVALETEVKFLGRW